MVDLGPCLPLIKLDSIIESVLFPKEKVIINRIGMKKINKTSPVPKDKLAWAPVWWFMFCLDFFFVVSMTSPKLPNPPNSSLEAQITHNKASILLCIGVGIRHGQLFRPYKASTACHSNLRFRLWSKRRGRWSCVRPFRLAMPYWWGLTKPKQLSIAVTSDGLLRKGWWDICKWSIPYFLDVSLDRH